MPAQPTTITGPADTTGASHAARPAEEGVGGSWAQRISPAAELDQAVAVIRRVLGAG
jgi:hypothetical protein